jgi:hypothetical protein
MNVRLAILALGCLVACATEVTDITVGVYSALPFASDNAVRAVCVDVSSRGLPTQRVLAQVPGGVPPRHLFDFRITPRDDDLSQPIHLTVVARTRAGCTMGIEVARASRVLRFIPNERTRETVVLGEPDPPPDGASMNPCPAGQTLCSGVCTNTRYDPRNCGACGVVCNASMYCMNGGCVCPAGQFLCDGMRCTDPRYDPDWCGVSTCGGRCPTVANGTRFCNAGRCVYTCNDNYEPFGGMCVHCGLAGEPICDRPMPCVPGLVVCDGYCRHSCR